MHSLVNSKPDQITRVLRLDSNLQGVSRELSHPWGQRWKNVSVSHESPQQRDAARASLFLTPSLPPSGTNGSLAEDTCFYNIGTMQCSQEPTVQWLRSLGMIASLGLAVLCMPTSGRMRRKLNPYSDRVGAGPTRSHSGAHSCYAYHILQSCNLVYTCMKTDGVGDPTLWRWHDVWVSM